MRMLTVLGARPQFIKAAAVSRRLARSPESRIEEAIVHTGQHYDEGMSGSFFRELGIPAPRWNLGAGGGSHGAQTGAMLTGLEGVIAEWRPDIVLVYGDTNSTLAGALAAAKAGISIAHVEAGLRSFRRGMPEEVNRVVTDRLSALLFCPTETAVANLATEGRSAGVHLVGDVMYDTFLTHAETADCAGVLLRFGVERGGYILATVHRAENTDDPVRLGAIMAGLAMAARECPILLPLHPRTQNAMRAAGIAPDRGVRLLPPLPYLDIVALLVGAATLATDSGGMQKEAYFAAIPCVTLRDETEWPETLTAGWNRLVPPSGDAGSAETIAAALLADRERTRDTPPPPVFGDGDAAGLMLDAIERFA